MRHAARWRVLTSVAMRRMVPWTMVAVLWVAGGCAYYNGMYNARVATRRAEALARAGREDSAAVEFARAARAANEVLLHHGASSWRAEALLLAGRGSALASAMRSALGAPAAGPRTATRECAHAVETLTEFLARADADDADDADADDADADDADIDPADRWRAETALAVCELQSGQRRAAGERLRQLAATTSDRIPVSVQTETRRWRARVALAADELPLADSLLAQLPAGEAEWERSAAAIARGDLARADALLRRRAAAGDARPVLREQLRALAGGGALETVRGVTAAYDASSVARAERARLHLFAGELLLASGDQAAARAEYGEVLSRFADDSVARGAARARLLGLDIAEVDSSAQLDDLLRTERSGTGADMPRGIAFERLGAAVTLFRLLLRTDDASGAAAYLAGEVARDSLRAPRLAVHTWRGLAARLPDAPLAARALYASALLDPALADALQTTILTRYPTSAMAALLRREGVQDHATQQAVDALLEGRWVIARRALDDSLRAPRRNPSDP